MSRGYPARAAAAGLLRFLLPVGVVAASIVAAQGLVRVVGQPAPSRQTQQSASLHLGLSAAPAAVTPPASPTPSTIPSRSGRAVAAPRPAASERLTRPVVVINASGITGLAGRTASILRLRGISVASIGNLSTMQRPYTRTVYYPPGERGQALTLATLTGAAAVAPAPRWLPPGGRLILVVTDAARQVRVAP